MDHIKPVIGYQVSDHDGNHWKDRPSYEILDRETAMADLFEAMQDSGGWELIPIYPDTIEEPTFCAGHPAVTAPDAPESARIAAESAEAVLAVSMSMIVTAGLYNGPVTRHMVADLVRDWLSQGDEFNACDDAIDTIKLVELRGGSEDWLPCLKMGA